ASAGDRFRRERRNLASQRFRVVQCAFRFFIRAEDVARGSVADLFTDLAGRASIFCSHSHRLDDTEPQYAETLHRPADCYSAWLLPATTGSTGADESVIWITTVGAAAGFANRVAYFRSGPG